MTNLFFESRYLSRATWSQTFMYISVQSVDTTEYANEYNKRWTMLKIV
jgi:hypothetical protein